MEKAEILEKTITYIKKLQEITGKQELKEGNKPDNPESQGENTLNFACKWVRVKLRLNFYSRVVFV